MKNRVFNLKKITYITVLLALAAILSTFTFSVSGANDESIAISKIILNKGQTELAFEISLPKEYVKENKSSPLYLFEIPLQNTNNGISSLEPVAEFKVNNKVSLKLPFENGNSNRLYSKFAVAEKSANNNYIVVSQAHYIDNFASYAQNTEPFPTGSSKKGLKIHSFTDAQLLGVQHTVIDLPINEYMFGEMTSGATPFVFNGRTFYISEEKLLMLDHTVRTYTESGINVYFNVVLTMPKADYHSDILNLYCEGISPESTYFALNTKSETSVNIFSAFINYICERYTFSDHRYGFVPAVILGYEVNYGKDRNDYGSLAKEEYVDSYITAFRIAYTAMRSHYSEGMVYLPVSNNFALALSEGTMSAKEFIDTFSNKISACGNIPWGLCVSPYPSQRDTVDYWNDSLAKDDITTEFITMKNIGILTDYMKEDHLTYNDEMRSIIIGEFALPGASNDDTSMTMQAAAYALAYYTADQNEHIDAFIYGCHTDNQNCLSSCGLWTSKSEDAPVSAAKKPIYNVFSMIDTAKSQEVTSFVKQTVDNGVFDTILSGKVKYKVFDDRTLITENSLSATEIKKGYKEKTLFDLTAGKLCNFYPSDSTEYVELRPLSDGSGTMLYSKITDIPTEYKGIGNAIEKDYAFKDACYITVRLMVAAPVEASSINVMLRLQKNGDSQLDTVVLEGTAKITPNQWYDVTFNIEDIVKSSDGDIDLLKLWINTDDRTPAEGEYGIWLENVVLHTKNGVSFIGGFFIFLLILVVIAILGYVALYLRAQYIRRRRREARERYRREQLRRQAMQQGHSAMQQSRPPMQSRSQTTQFPTAGQPYQKNISRKENNDEIN